MEKSGADFSVPGVSAADLRRAGEKADQWDEVVSDIELALRTAKQANLLDDAEAYNMLRKVNNQVKAQEAFNPKLKERFGTVVEYFSRRSSKTGGASKTGE
jgi:argonaute-like protein implicated in RNA metabolism and viral defense